MASGFGARDFFGDVTIAENERFKREKQAGFPLGTVSKAIKLKFLYKSSLIFMTLFDVYFCDVYAKKKDQKMVHDRENSTIQNEKMDAKQYNACDSNLFKATQCDTKWFKSLATDIRKYLAIITNFGLVNPASKENGLSKS